MIFAILLIASSFFLGQLTAGQDVKIIKDLGLAATAVFGLFIAIFIGIGLVSKEVERRSIYGLLAKPISRPQLILGKYAGLVLTLAVNVTVMTVALYAVLAYMTWTTAPALQTAWDAPGIDPRLLKSVFLIFVELMLITALALFFSTFSTPLLSAALTLGLYIVGHFNADLRNFEKVVESKTAAWLARGLYHLLPDLSAFDVKTQVVHGLEVPAGYLALTAGYGFLYIAPAAHRVDPDFLAAGLQVTARTRQGPPAATLAAIAGIVLCVAGAVSLQIARDRLYAGQSRETARILYVRSGEAVKRLALDFDALWADVYWIRAIQHYGGERLNERRAAELRAPVPAPRSDDDARSVTSASPIASARSS